MFARWSLGRHGAILGQNHDFIEKLPNIGKNV
jgi:hypothetical protein